ncbi:response regulator transcription factor [Corynebacterium canis]|uniref:Response regulator transcription factor n=1 Tax=Corynebacterium canis TaxID=679663 RepID=A0A5C5UBL5_9CORY|nr:response regulator transcription factor [Corynebacterium canis]TWT22890.1 response regulator transcription factor [Corynebacterium canis]WJY76497.1 Transcriptional regulatory protein WalR [Corynebacterium canis]
MDRILVVDDEPGIRDVLVAYLQQENFQVRQAGTAQEALETISEWPPELVLLDIGLPDVDGLEVLRRIRAQSSAFVILVTARTDETDILVGLGVGADDYITKPFSPREVIARVKAVLRRNRPAAATDTSLLRVDTARREVLLEGKPVQLSALDFDLLAALAESPGRVFSRAQLLESVWGYDFFGDERVVDVHIRTIRHVLGDDATSPRIIATVRGVGYKYIGGDAR